MISWRINADYSKHQNDDSIDLAIANCKEDNSIWQLSEEDLHRVIAFGLWKEKVVDWDGEVEDGVVKQRIEEMRNKI